MAVYALVVEGLEHLGQFADLPDKVKLDAVRAINKITPSIRAESAARILRQINFPEAYLQPAARRLYVSRLATRGKLEAAITARRRPTSLARFITGPVADKQVGVQVKVKASGKTETLRRAFVVRLKGDADTRGNFGLAVRLPKGEALRGRSSAVKLAKGLYLLYGPSVQQVFLDNQGEGVAADVSPLALDRLADEYQRLFDARIR